MTDEELANQMALRQLGMYHEHDEHHEYNEHRFSPDRRHNNNHAAVVTDVAKKIARAAFSSEDRDSGFSVRIRTAGSGFWDLLKSTFEKPGAKEGLILSSIFIFKIGLWYAYRHASDRGLNVIDL